MAEPFTPEQQQADNDRMNHEAEALIRSAVAERSVEKAREAGLYAGRIVSLVVANKPYDVVKPAFDSFVRDFATFLDTCAKAQGMPTDEVQPLWRAFWLGHTEAVGAVAKVPEGRA